MYSVSLAMVPCSSITQYQFSFYRILSLSLSLSHLYFSSFSLPLSLSPSTFEPLYGLLSSSPLQYRFTGWDRVVGPFLCHHPFSFYDLMYGSTFVGPRSIELPPLCLLSLSIPLYVSLTSLSQPLFSFINSPILTNISLFIFVFTLPLSPSNYLSSLSLFSFAPSFLSYSISLTFLTRKESKEITLPLVLSISLYLSLSPFPPFSVSFSSLFSL